MTELSAEGQKRLERGSLLRILDSKQDGHVAAAAPSILDSLTPESKEYWAAIQEGLAEMGLSYVVNAKLMRGLDYYQDTVFEFVYAGEELGPQQSTILAGGRYDALIGSVAQGLGTSGLENVSAAGWAMGVDRLNLLTSEIEAAAPVVGVISIVPQPWRGVALTSSLVAQGIQACLLGGKSIGAQLKEASQRKCQFVVIQGPDELAKECVSIRNMVTGDQTVVAASKVNEHLQ
jgi:histidyl-tRNA synthetase